MERQGYIVPQKIVRKRIQCDICESHILQGFLKMHHVRCQFLATLRKCSSKIMQSSQKKEIKKQQQNSERSGEECEILEKEQQINTESEQDDRQNMQKVYGQLIRKTRQSEAQSISKRRRLIDFDIDDDREEACYFCGHKIRHRIVHEEFCSSRHNFCQYCGQESSRELMGQHHLNCLERIRINKIEALMHDSDQDSSSDSEPEGRVFRPRPSGTLINHREDDIYQTNPYARNSVYEWRDPNLIYTHTPPIQGSPYYFVEAPGMHRPLYRYRRQFFPIRHQPIHVDNQLEKRVTQSLIRYGYDLSGLERLRGNPKFQHYLRLIDGFIEDNEDPFSEGMTQYEIDRLQIKKFELKKTQKQQQEDICAICYTVFEENEDIIKLTCNHYFHEFCVKKWLEVNFRCPICKVHQVSRKISIQI